MLYFFGEMVRMPDFENSISGVRNLHDVFCFVVCLFVLFFILDFLYFFFFFFSY